MSRLPRPSSEDSRQRRRRESWTRKNAKQKSRLLNMDEEARLEFLRRRNLRQKRNRDRKKAEIDTMDEESRQKFLLEFRRKANEQYMNYSKRNETKIAAKHKRCYERKKLMMNSNGKLKNGEIADERKDSRREKKRPDRWTMRMGAMDDQTLHEFRSERAEYARNRYSAYACTGRIPLYAQDKPLGRLYVWYGVAPGQELPRTLSEFDAGVVMLGSSGHDYRPRSHMLELRWERVIQGGETKISKGNELWDMGYRYALFEGPKCDIAETRIDESHGLHYLFNTDRPHLLNANNGGGSISPESIMRGAEVIKEIWTYCSGYEVERKLYARCDVLDERTYTRAVQLYGLRKAEIRLKRYERGVKLLTKEIGERRRLLKEMGESNEEEDDLKASDACEWFDDESDEEYSMISLHDSLSSVPERSDTLKRSRFSSIKCDTIPPPGIVSSPVLYDLTNSLYGPIDSPKESSSSMAGMSLRGNRSRTVSFSQYEQLSTSATSSLSEAVSLSMSEQERREGRSEAPKSVTTTVVEKKEKRKLSKREERERTVEENEEESEERDDKPSHLSVTCESHLHNVPRGAEKHFLVQVVSNECEGKIVLQRSTEGIMLARQCDGGFPLDSDDNVAVVRKRNDNERENIQLFANEMPMEETVSQTAIEDYPLKGKAVQQNKKRRRSQEKDRGGESGDKVHDEEESPEDEDDEGQNGYEECDLNALRKCHAEVSMEQQSPRKRDLRMRSDSQRVRSMNTPPKQAKPSRDRTPTPSHLSVTCESHLHNVPRGAEKHFLVQVVSNEFEGGANGGGRSMGAKKRRRNEKGKEKVETGRQRKEAIKEGIRAVKDKITKLEQSGYVFPLDRIESEMGIKHL